MRVSKRTTVATFVLGVALGAVTLPAVAQVGFVQSRTATSPTVSLSTNGAFIVGSQIGQATPPQPDECTFDGYHFADIPLKMKWRGSGSDHKGADLFRGRRGEFDEVPVIDNQLVTSYRYLIGDYDGTCGGTNDDVDFRVVAHTRTGDASVRITTDTIAVWQDNGRSPAFADSILDHRSGTWTESPSDGACGCHDLDDPARCHQRLQARHQPPQHRRRHGDRPDAGQGGRHVRRPRHGRRHLCLLAARPGRGVEGGRVARRAPHPEDHQSRNGRTAAHRHRRHHGVLTDRVLTSGWPAG